MSEASALLRPLEPAPETFDEAAFGLRDRVAATLEVFRARGYAVPLDRFAGLLHGGPVEPALVARAASSLPEARLVDGFLAHASAGEVFEASRHRQHRHLLEAPHFEAVAAEFGHDLARTCPWVESVLLAGSLSSNGFVAEDDVDFNLIVADGTKYVTYIAALLVGLKYAWRHRHRAVADEAWTPFLPKVVCINVVWERRQTRPFVRSDPQMAFELLMSRPLVGAEAFHACLHENPRLVAHFPQMLAHSENGHVPPPSGLGRFLSRLVGSRRRRRALDNACLLFTRAAHRLVYWSRRKNEAARTHVEFVESVKRPYAILDPPGEPAP